jgi:Spy/CpxP family protein refolding chaperone
MKNLLIALAIVFGLCLQSASAQTETPKAATPQAPKHVTKSEVAESVKADLAKISKELQLTDDQKAQIKTILTAQYEKIQPIRAESRAKIHAVLTPEQQAKWDAMKAEHGKKSEPPKEMK